MNKCDKEELINMLLQNLDEELKAPEKWYSAKHELCHSSCTIYSSNFTLHYSYNGCIAIYSKGNYLTKIDNNYSKFEIYTDLIRSYITAYIIVRESVEYLRDINKSEVELLPEKLRNEEECVRLSKLLNLPTEETELDKLIKIYEKVLEPLKQRKLKEKLDRGEKGLEEHKIYDERREKERLILEYERLSFFGKIIYRLQNRHK